MDEKRSDDIRAKNPWKKRWTAYWDFKSPFYLLSFHSFRSSCPLKEKIRKNDKEEFRDRGRRGDVGFIYLNFIHKNRCALNVHIFVAVFVPANHIDPIHTRLPFLPFNNQFLDVRASREKRKDKNWTTRCTFDPGSSPSVSNGLSSFSIIRLQNVVCIPFWEKHNSQRIFNTLEYISERQKRETFNRKKSGSNTGIRLNHSFGPLAFTIDRLLRGRVSMASQSVLHSVRTSGQANGRFLFLDRDTGPGIVS